MQQLPEREWRTIVQGLEEEWVTVRFKKTELTMLMMYIAGLILGFTIGRRLLDG